MNDQYLRYKSPGGEIQIWVDPDSGIQIKCCTNQYNDPAEIHTMMAREIAQILARIADEVDSQ